MQKILIFSVFLLLLVAAPFAIAIENETDNATGTNDTETGPDTNKTKDVPVDDDPYEEDNKEEYVDEKNENLDHDEKNYPVGEIFLKGGENYVKWETEGDSPEGFKVVWSMNEDPTYPLRNGDKSHYVNHDVYKAWLNAFDGAGTYFVRVCTYSEEECLGYSNQIKIELYDEDHEKDYKENYEEHEGDLKRPVKVEDLNKASCQGCLLEDTCYPTIYRKDGLYCDIFGEFVNQSGEGEICENNFECDSNVCISGECISATLIQKVVNWFKNFFA